MIILTSETIHPDPDRALPTSYLANEAFMISSSNLKEKSLPRLFEPYKAEYSGQTPF